MSITPLSDNVVFEPPVITAMAKALDGACAALQVFADDTKRREMIAARVIDLARSGVCDAEAMRDRVILAAKSPA